MGERSKQGSDITRRDFLDGVALTIGSAGLAMGISSPASASDEATNNYPPGLQGMRGFEHEAMEAGHAVRDGRVPEYGDDSGEVYDLVIVGAGMSGLSAAYFYRRQVPGAKILVLEGSDDFGGHARRVEVDVGGRQVLAPGGTVALDSPYTYSAESRQLLTDIGVDIERFYEYRKADRPELRKADGKRMPDGLFFAKEYYGRDHLIPDMSTGRSPEEWRKTFADTPLSKGAKAGMVRLLSDKTDYLPGLSREEKVRRLQKISYLDYLRDIASIHPDALALLTKTSYPMNTNQAAGIDTMSAFYAWRRGEYGFAGLGERPPHQRSSLTANEGRWVQFPDGNATVARLLIRWLIPETLPGSTMEDSIGARMAYDKLDLPTNDVRVRLSSMVTRVKHLGDQAGARQVVVSYLRGGEASKVKAGAVVMACFNSIIPYLVHELPEEQKSALHQAVRKPLMQVWVVLRNARALHRLGCGAVETPGMFYCGFQQWRQSAVGGAYKVATTPDEPVIVLMNLSPEIIEAPGSGLPPREQWKIARSRLQSISFETLERNAREQLDRVLGSAGFESDRDIAGITVCRWAHGYAGGTNSLYDPDWTGRTDPPWVVGRKRFGRIVIANSDSAAVSLTNAAFAQSHRAVTELVNDVLRPVYDFYWSESDRAGLAE